MCAAVAQASFDRGRGIAGAAAARKTFVFAEGVGLVSNDDDNHDSGDNDDEDGSGGGASAARHAAAAAIDNVCVVLPCAEGVGAGCERYGSFTWPSAVVLAQAVWHHANAWVTGKAVLELGAGECARDTAHHVGFPPRTAQSPLTLSSCGCATDRCSSGTGTCASFST